MVKLSKLNNLYFKMRCQIRYFLIQKIQVVGGDIYKMDHKSMKNKIFQLLLILKTKSKMKLTGFETQKKKKLKKKNQRNTQLT